MSSQNQVKKQQLNKQLLELCAPPKSAALLLGRCFWRCVRVKDLELNDLVDFVFNDFNYSFPEAVAVYMY